MSPVFDLLIQNGTIYDGSGDAPYTGDVASKGDTIAALGQLNGASASTVIDARGLAVAPGFINMLSWATESLIADGRSQSDIRQGVTLEVMGESFSMGPLNAAMKDELRAEQGDIKYEVAWTTLNEYLEYLARRGVSTNVASFVGSASVRTHVLGHTSRPPTPAELQQMCALVRQAMAEGAVGLSSALIYVPDCFNRPEDLLAMARVAADYDGLYISHLRSEADHLLEGIDELLAVARAAGVRAEIYHLKVAGRSNWRKIDAMIEKIETARAQGVHLTADMYTYTAGATGLNGVMPPWVQEGGFEAWRKRLKDPDVRQRLRREIAAPGDGWENMYDLASSPENVLLTGFKSQALKPLAGKTLAEVAALRGASPIDTAMDLVIEDGSRVDTVYFTMSEDNLRRELTLPWVSFCSDAASLAPEGVFLRSNCHPRAYGAFARLLGKYVRDEKIVSLQEAIRRLTALPAANLKLDRRGRLQPGYFADVVVFDPATIQDHATFARPHQYAAGVQHVVVNGTQVIKDAEHTGATPGRVVHGPGRRT